LFKEVHGADSIGPVILGLSKPVHVLQLGASVDEMVNMAALAAVDAQQREKKK
jgi:malate dehydrogenase (oxaloacetate-decarboxylating)(NADP+)